MKSIFTLLLASLALISFSTKTKEIVRDVKFVEKNLVYIPASVFNMGSQDQYAIKLVETEHFYMFNQEVSNGFYVDFINYLKQNDPEKHKKALPDTLVWRDKLFFGEKHVDYYLRHPAYREYPVVGVTYDQCLMFCDWLTARYNADPKRSYQKVIFTLPDSAQRERASRGKLADSRFPWEAPDLQEKGKWLANFMIIDQAGILRETLDGKEYLVASKDHWRIAGSLDEFADVVAPVTSYKSYGFGLYNMSGNVEEFILQKGKTMGGSWRDPGYYLQNNIFEAYDENNEATSARGFRFIMKVIEK